MLRKGLVAMLAVVLVLGFGCAAAGRRQAVVSGQSGKPTDPVYVYHAPRAITVDGDLSDWAGVPFMPLPFMQKGTSSFRLCWSEQGLYGAVVAKDESIEVTPDAPWQGDCAEFFVDKDFSRSWDMTENSAQYTFAPDPNNQGGKCVVNVPQGAERDMDADIPAVWKRVPGGYVIEFLLPASLLAPAKMQAGTKLGLNFALDDGGQPVEQFFHDKDEDESYRSPETWGAVMLQQ